MTAQPHHPASMPASMPALLAVVPPATRTETASFEVKELDTPRADEKNKPFHREDATDERLLRHARKNLRVTGKLAANIYADVIELERRLSERDSVIGELRRQIESRDAEIQRLRAPKTDMIVRTYPAGQNPPAGRVNPPAPNPVPMNVPVMADTDLPVVVKPVPPAATVTVTSLAKVAAGVGLTARVALTAGAVAQIVTGDYTSVQGSYSASALRTLKSDILRGQFPRYKDAATRVRVFKALADGDTPAQIAARERVNLRSVQNAEAVMSAAMLLRRSKSATQIILPGGL